MDSNERPMRNTSVSGDMMKILVALVCVTRSVCLFPLHCSCMEDLAVVTDGPAQTKRCQKNHLQKNLLHTVFGLQ